MRKASNTPTKVVREAILWWSLAAFNAGLLVGIGAMLLEEWVG